MRCRLAWVEENLLAGVYMGFYLEEEPPGCLKEGGTYKVMIGEWVETRQRWMQTSLGVFGDRVIGVG